MHTKVLSKTNKILLKEMNVGQIAFRQHRDGTDIVVRCVEHTRLCDKKFWISLCGNYAWTEEGVGLNDDEWTLLPSGSKIEVTV